MSQLLSSKDFEVSDSYLAYLSTDPDNFPGKWGDTSPKHNSRTRCGGLLTHLLLRRWSLQAF